MRYGRDTAKSTLASLLGPNERVLWSGGPASGPVGGASDRMMGALHEPARRIARIGNRALPLVVLAWVALFVSTAYAGLPREWMPGRIAWVALFALPALAIALPGLVDLLGTRTIYAVTDRRVLAFSNGPGGGLTSRDLASLELVDVEDARPDGRGTVRFTPMRTEQRRHPGSAPGQGYYTVRVPDESTDALVRPTPVFENVANAVAVARIAYDARARRRAVRVGDNAPAAASCASDPMPSTKDHP